jgi:hypothetical protein
MSPARGPDSTAPNPGQIFCGVGRLAFSKEPVELYFHRFAMKTVLNKRREGVRYGHWVPLRT